MLNTQDIQLIRQLFREEIEPIHKRIDDLELHMEKRFTEIYDIIKDIYLEIAKLREDVDILKHDVSVLKEDVEVLKKDVAVLKEDVNELKNDMKFVKKNVGNLEDQSLKRETKLHTLFTDIKIQLQEVVPYKRTLHDHDNRIQRLEKNSPAN